MSTLSVNKITDLTDFTFPSTTTISLTGVNASGASIFGSANITSNLSVTGTANVGNLSVTSTGGRITGDFSNATLASRAMFQSSTVNGNTLVRAIPNGTGNQAGFQSSNGSDPANSSVGYLTSAVGDIQIGSGINGTGTYLPMTFYTGGSERARIDTSGNMGIGTSSLGAGYRVSIVGSAVSSVPLYLHSDATNGYVYSPNPLVIGSTGAYTLSLVTNNTTKFLIGSAGQLGIGGATYGTSGQVLTSGGASAAPTWSTPAAASGTVTSITAGTGLSGGTITTSGTIALVTTLGAVGTYALLRSSSSVTAGSTYAGSGLQYTGSRLINSSCATVFLPNQSAAASPSGTWQAMGTTVTDPTGQYAGTLFIRTA